MQKCLVVVKIRGTVARKKKQEKPLTFLHLGHTNHAVLIDGRASLQRNASACK